MAIKDNYPTVMEVPVKNSPAEKAGLKTNDVIVKVDGQSTEGVALSEVVSKIRGKKERQLIYQSDEANRPLIST